MIAMIKPLMVGKKINLNKYVFLLLIIVYFSFYKGIDKQPINISKDGNYQV